MTREDFIKAEADASRAFMDRFVLDDFVSRPGSVDYSREYRCDCGFVTDDSGAIFDHTCRGVA